MNPVTRYTRIMKKNERRSKKLRIKKKMNKGTGDQWNERSMHDESTIVIFRAKYPRWNIDAISSGGRWSEYSWQIK